ncbi:MAG: hypothetical protein ACXAD7_09915 [Candidatus Kariarchaeaceae archaeon]
MGSDDYFDHDNPNCVDVKDSPHLTTEGEVVRRYVDSAESTTTPVIVSNSSLLVVISTLLLIRSRNNRHWDL